MFFFQILTLTASANKLTKILERVDEYTALIMEELDPNHLGYIEVLYMYAEFLLLVYCPCVAMGSSIEINHSIVFIYDIKINGL
jgi:hypothetical protein